MHICHSFSRKRGESCCCVSKEGIASENSENKFMANSRSYLRFGGSGAEIAEEIKRVCEWNNLPGTKYIIFEQCVAASDWLLQVHATVSYVNALYIIRLNYCSKMN